MKRILLKLSCCVKYIIGAKIQYFVGILGSCGGFLCLFNMKSVIGNTLLCGKVAFLLFSICWCYGCIFLMPFKTGCALLNVCYKTHVNAHKTCIIPESPYLCIVFFIVLDLRLTKGWSSAELLFLCPYLNNKNSGPENKSFQARNFYFMLLSFTSVQS